MLNYTYGLNGGAPGKAWMVDRFVTFDAVKADLARAKESSDFVIVFAHWGEEDTFRPNDYEKTWAQVLADGGADLIIGGHPHVVQPARVLMAEDGREVPVSTRRKLSHQTQAKKAHARRHGERHDLQRRLPARTSSTMSCCRP